MKKFLQENWFKVGILIILLLLFILGVYVVLSKNNVKDSQDNNFVLVNETLSKKAILNSTTSPIVESISIYPKTTKINQLKTVSNVGVQNNTQKDIIPDKIIVTTANTPNATATTNTDLYTHSTFINELSDVYKKVVVDFGNSTYVNIMTLVYKGDMGEALGYINTGYSIISTQKDKIRNIENRYTTLDYDDTKALYGMKKAIDNFYLSLITLKKVYTRNGSEYGFKSYDIDSVNDTNSMARSYIDDVYQYLLLQ